MIQDNELKIKTKLTKTINTRLLCDFKIFDYGCIGLHKMLTVCDKFDIIFIQQHKECLLHKSNKMTFVNQTILNAEFWKG